MKDTEIRITIRELSEQVNLSERTIKNHLPLLKETGLINCVGSDTTGYWKRIYSEED